MADTQGTVNWVKVNNAVGADLGTFSVARSDGSGDELLFIWWTATLRDTPSVTQRLLWMAQLALVRDALVTGKSVTVSHDDNSPFVINVQVNKV